MHLDRQTGINVKLCYTETGKFLEHKVLKYRKLDQSHTARNPTLEKEQLQTNASQETSPPKADDIT